VSGYEVVRQSGTQQATAQCPSGKSVLGGGYTDGSSITESHPNATNDGWFVRSNKMDQAVIAWAICAFVQ
jgi:hypothetical protein